MARFLVGRRLAVLVAAAAVLAATDAATGADAQVPARNIVMWPAVPIRYQAPIGGPLLVLRPFQRPPTPYAAGHRGVDLATASTAVVRAAGAGRVTFAGQVARRGVVVLLHGDGVRTEYEPVIAVVRAGEHVSRGQPIGQLSGSHGGCPVDGCLHWGARRADNYFDPLLLLRPLGPVRLLPWVAMPATQALGWARP